jgi:hypothetical protein
MHHIVDFLVFFKPTLVENLFMNQAAKTPTGHGYTASQTIASFDD